MNGRPPSTPKHCAATRKDGQSCTAPTLTSSVYCFVHDPDRVADRDAARRKGGQNRASIVRLRGLVPPRLLSVYDILEHALTETHDGRLDPRAAMAMAALARAMTTVLTAGEYEQRLRALEQPDNQQSTGARSWA